MGCSACASASPCMAASWRRAPAPAAVIASARRSPYRESVRRAWQLGREYWVDVLVVAGLGVWLGNSVAWPAQKGGPQGPVWFDVLGIVLCTTPLLARRRY